jgi:ribosome recycling factor
MENQEAMKEEFKRVYQIYSANKTEAKIISDDFNDQVKALAKKLEVKSGFIKKAFSSLYKLSKTGTDELRIVEDLLHEMGKEDVVEE